MPKATKPTPVITLASDTRDNLAGIVVSAFVPFASMRDEKAGMQYANPRKSRNEAGELVKDTDGKTQLYDLKDGGTTTTPFEADGRTIRAEVATEAKQATPHIDWSKSVTSGDVVWPDGKIRTVNISLKANAPQTPEEFAASKSAASATRTSKALDTATDEALIDTLRKRGIPENVLAQMAGYKPKA